MYTGLCIELVLLQTDEQEVINFLLTTEIIPLCLRIMESGSELSKTVSMCVTACVVHCVLCACACVCIVCCVCVCVCV